MPAERALQKVKLCPQQIKFGAQVVVRRNPGLNSDMAQRLQRLGIAQDHCLHPVRDKR